MTDLTGVIDLHVHAGPDVRPRKLDAVVYDLDPVQGIPEFLQQMAGQSFGQAEIDLMTRGPRLGFWGWSPGR